MFKGICFAMAMVVVFYASVMADMVGHFPLDEIVSGNTSDASVNGNDGVVVDATVETGGVQGNSFSFTGGYNSDADVVIVNGSECDDLTTMSISLWFKVSTLTQQYRRIIQKGANGSPGGYTIYFGDDSGEIKLEVYKWDGTPGRWRINGYASVGEWNHLVVVYNSSSKDNDAVFYFNGALANSSEQSAPTGNPRSDAGLPFVIGGRSTIDGSLTDRGYAGMLDEVRLYNTELSSQEVSDLYLRESCIGHWKFEGNMLDETGNNTAVMNGCTYDPEGPDGSGVRFNGTSDYLSLGTLRTLGSRLSNSTMACWLKWENESGWQAAVAGRNSSYQYDFQVNRKADSQYSDNPGDVFFYMRDQAGNVKCFSTDAAGYHDNVWRHYAWVVNNGSVSLFIDGDPVSLISAMNDTHADLVDFSTPMFAGNRSNSGSTEDRWYEGGMDDLRFYTKALSESEIKAIINKAQPGGGTQPPLASDVWTSSGDDIYYSGGNVGIGIDQPSRSLHVDGPVLTNRYDLNTVYGSWQPSDLPTIYSASSEVGATEYPFTEPGHMVLQAKASGAVGHDIVFATGNNDNPKARMVVDGTGDVGIGINAPEGKLHIWGNEGGADPGYVGLKISNESSWPEVGIQLECGDGDGLAEITYAKYGNNQNEILIEDVNYDEQNDVPLVLRVKGEIKVETPGADFVFDPDYKLRTLEQVESHIQEKQHLPEIPSAADMQANGMGVSEMQTKLLQKVEELTLYLIEQNKRLEAVERENGELRKAISE